MNKLLAFLAVFALVLSVFGNGDGPLLLGGEKAPEAKGTNYDFPDKLLYSFTKEYSGYEGLEVERQMRVVDRPRISQTRDVGIHDHHSIIILRIKNPDQFDKENFYISQDFSKIAAEQGKNYTWEFTPQPSSLQAGKAIHTFKELEAGSTIEISLDVGAKLDEEDFDSLEKPSINYDSSSVFVNAPAKAEVGQKVRIELKGEDGRPLARTDVSVIDPEGKVTLLKTDQQGGVDFLATKEGTYIYRVSGARMGTGSETRVEPGIVVPPTTADISKKEPGLFSFDLGGFAGIIAGLILVAVALLAVAVFLSLREKDEEPGEPKPVEKEAAPQSEWKVETKTASMTEAYEASKVEDREAESTRRILEERRKTVTGGPGPETRESGLKAGEGEYAFEKYSDEREISEELGEESEMVEEGIPEDEESGMEEGEEEKIEGKEEEEKTAPAQIPAKPEFSKEELDRMAEAFKKLSEQEEKGRIKPVYRPEKRETVTEVEEEVEEIEEPLGKREKPARKMVKRKRHESVKKAIEKLERITKRKK